MSVKNKEDSYVSLTSALSEYCDQNISEKNENALINELKLFQDVKVIISSGDLEQRQFVHYVGKTLSLVDSSSQVAWSILDILFDLCNAPESERILNHLQKLTPLVSNLLLRAVAEDKQVVMLRVLQALTYGIRIPHPDTFVAPLISLLIDFLKPGTETTIIQLSLSVLANLLYRNKAVLFSLIQTVKIKDLMSDLLSVRSNTTCKLEVCKLMFLLEDFIHEKPDDGEVSSFLKLSFRTIMQSASTKSTSHLRHCVSFFADLVKENKINVTSLGEPWFNESVEKVINLLGDMDKCDIDCAMLLFKFLRVFVQMEIPSFSNFHYNIMKQGIAWTIEHKRKASEVIITMQCILASQIQSQSNQGNGMTVDELITVFVPLLSETSNIRSDSYFLIGLLNFLSTVLEVDIYKIVLKTYFEKETIERLLESASNIDNQNNFNVSEPVVQMYVHLIIFVNKVVTCCNSSWKNFYTGLLRDQRLLTILAAALVSGSSELKGKVLSLVASDEFPRDSLDLLSKSMAKCGSRPISVSTLDDSKEMQFSSQLASIYVDVNKLIRNIKNSKREDLQHISSSQVFQLLEYKQEVNSDYQRSLISCLTHATGGSSLLQEELFIANEVISKLQQQVNCLQKTLDNARKENSSYIKVLEEKEQGMSNLKNRLIEEQSKSQCQIEKLKESSELAEKDLTKATLQIQNLKEQLVEKADSLKSILKDEEALKEEKEKLNIKVEGLTKDLECMGSQLEEARKENARLEQDKKAKEKEIMELQRIRDTVFELTGGRKKFS